MNKKLILTLILTLLVIGIILILYIFLKKFGKNILPNEVYKLIGQCESNPHPTFSHDITALSKIDYIVPPGNIEDYGDYKILKTHSYMKGPEKVAVYAPIDSTLYQGVYYQEGGINQYSLFFEVSCEVYFLFDHIVDPPDKIKEAFPDTPSSTTNTRGLSSTIPFKAGDLIGYSIGKDFEQWDFGVYNRTVRQNFDELDLPNISGRDYQAVCPFDYFPEEKRQEYYSLFGSHISKPVPTRFCNSE